VPLSQEEYRTDGRGKMDVVEEASAAQEALGVIVNGFTVQTIYSLRTCEWAVKWLGGRGVGVVGRLGRRGCVQLRPEPCKSGA
jgi:hypothetical protein